MSIAKSGSLEIYKGKSAVKFSLIPPTRGEKGWIDRYGAILIEAASAKGKRDDGLPDIDWSKKITFALQPNDISLLLDPSVTKIVHEKDQKIKTLSFIPGTEKYEGTMGLQLTEVNGELSNRVFVGMSAGEYASFSILLKAALPILVGWNLTAS